MGENIVMLKVADILPHPENPRKDLGDLTELAESIRKNGIMQNLTVVDAADANCTGKYVALIGHRRLAAAKEAGVEEVPCKIAKDLSKKEQIGIMLEENMQRNDLTITEQAFGFQMMLDLGETEKSIAEKTGFSRSTVRSRLQIAKLKPELVTKATEQYQLTLADLAELQKIKDPERRNKALEGCESKWELIRAVNDAVREEHMAAAMQVLKPIFKELGISKGSGDTGYRSWDGNCRNILQFRTDNLPKKEDITIPEGKKAFWTKEWNDEFTIYYFEKDPEEREKERNTAQEAAKKRVEKSEKLDALNDELLTQEREFIQCLVDGEFRIYSEEELAAWNALWPIVEQTANTYEEPEDFFEKDGKEKAADLDPIIRAILKVFVSLDCDRESCHNWNNEYNTENAEIIKGFEEFLEEYGFEITGERKEEIEAYLDGTHELYTRRDE